MITGLVLLSSNCFLLYVSQLREQHNQETAKHNQETANVPFN